MAFFLVPIVIEFLFAIIIIAFFFGRKERKSYDSPRIDPITPVPPFEGLIMTSTPPAESSSVHLPYDVFINHCGKDTKHTVANSIYEKLNDAGLRVFLDKNELEPGDFFPEVLEKAIKSALLHIAIFSTNYATSAWCLAELAFMMRLQPRIKFIPIFYHVEPDTLRWAIKSKGIYANAFNEYENKRRYTTKLQSWKEALHNASFFTGKKINNQCDEQAKLIDVVDHVLKELKVVRLDVAQHPVGLDEVEQEFYKKIGLQSTPDSIQIVGISGMGGVGKTTLAKHLYNNKYTTIKRSSFLFDIREATCRGRLHEKQKKLLQDLDFKGASTNFDNIDEGKVILRKKLKSASVFIILDDVDHKDQLDALLPARESLGPGSLIIVTTRELCVLKEWNISNSDIYIMKPLNYYYAKDLFCWHAFRQTSPFTEFKELVDKFVDACHGLPLSLKVLGSLLYSESREKYLQSQWKLQLDKLSIMLPNDIKTRLKISYDALDKHDKKMFLDVACFFIGWRSTSAIAVWDGSQWSGLLGWQKLVNKCLVEIESNGLIRMHDHLRDLGRDIANKKSPHRLWSKQQIIEIHSQQEAIRGISDAFGDNCYLRNEKIILNTSQGERILAPGSLGLKILISHGDFINKECRELSRELLCFLCERFKHKNLPSWLPLKNLRVLELFKASELEDLWECDEHAPLQLRQLVIRLCCRLNKLSGLQRLGSLEILTLHSCPELKTLPSLAEFTSLKEIELTNCYKLEEIESLEGLISLEKLTICFNNKLNTLPSLAKLTSLKEIDLNCCSKLEKIESLEGLKSLEQLKIHWCEELNTLPSLAELTSLKEIDLSSCSKLEKIESLEGLISLEKLTIRLCTDLNTLPRLAELTSLKEIVLTHCFKLEKIESLKGLISLEKLEIDLCEELNTLPSLAESTSLKEIDLSRCSKLQKIEGLESLISLEQLTINSCIELKKIERLEGLISLEKLTIYSCEELKTLPSLAKLTSLKEIVLNSCSKLEKIESLEGLKSLKQLKIDWCEELNTLPSLAELTSLEEFELSECEKVEKVEGLEVLRSLKKLKVHLCSMRPCMLNLKHCERMESLEVVANRVVVEASIPEIQKVIICTRAVIDVMSVRSFFTSLLPENVVEYLGQRSVCLRMSETGGNGNAILICFIIHSIHPYLCFQITNSSNEWFYTKMSNGEWVGMGNSPEESIWVWMGIFPQQSKWLHSEEYTIATEEDQQVSREENSVVKEGWVLRGTEQSVREHFRRLTERSTSKCFSLKL